jgi:hypothetical protein
MRSRHPLVTAALLALLAACSSDDAAQPDARLPVPEQPDATTADASTTDARAADASVADAGTAPDAMTAPPALVVAGGPLALVEGQDGTFTVALDAAPAGAITVHVASSLPAAFRAVPATLHFDATTWSAPQAVTVTALEDDDAAGATGAVTARAAGLADAAVAVQVVDNDSLAISAPANVLLREGGATFFVVTLSRPPSQAVAVTVTSEIPGLLAASPATLTFTPTTWHVPQRVDVTAATDADLADGRVALALASDGLATVTVAATIVDVTLPRVSVSASTLQLDEGNGTTVMVRLLDRPARDTVVTLAASDPDAVVARPARLTFTPATFDRGQPVVIGTAVDADGDDEQVAVDLAIGDQVQTSIAVRVNDHIVRAIRATPSPFAAAEGARRDLEVVLTAAPADAVVVRARSEDTASAVVTPAAIAFTRTSWNVPQRITVIGVDDADVADETTAVVLEADGHQAARVEVTVDDDDTQELLATQGLLRVVEGSTGEVIVALRRPPGRPVVVTAAVAATGVATVAPAALTFTDATWNVPQRVVLTGVRDTNTVNDHTELRLRSEGAADLVREVEVVDTRVP